MTISPIDRRLMAAELSPEEFVGDFLICGDAPIDDSFLDTFPRDIWEHLPEYALLCPVHGYSLRAFLPNSSHAVFLTHDETLVGVFTESDTLVLHGDHQGKGLGKELVLLAFAQKPWRCIQGRKVSSAGYKTLIRAHELARKAQRVAQADGPAFGESTASLGR